MHVEVHLTNKDTEIRCFGSDEARTLLCAFNPAIVRFPDAVRLLQSIGLQKVAASLLPAYADLGFPLISHTVLASIRLGAPSALTPNDPPS